MILYKLFKTLWMIDKVTGIFDYLSKTFDHDNAMHLLRPGLKFQNSVRASEASNNSMAVETKGWQPLRYTSCFFIN